MNNQSKRTKHLVIIGGGFAGATLAKSLEKKLPKEWEIYLLSKTNFITYNPLLPEVVGASVLPAHVESPLRLMLKRTRIRMVTVDDIDFEEKVVHYHNDEKSSLRYDELVFAAGVGANVDMLPGLKEHALPLKTVGDALYIRNRVIERLEQATIHSDPERRRQLTKFIIIGGGFSGVEVAGELEDFLKSAERYYKNVKFEDCRVTILHGTDRLLPELSEKLGNKTTKNFINRGIDVRLKARAAKIEDEKVILNTGETIEAATIICTIGTLAHNFYQETPLPLNRGKIVAEPDFSVSGVKNVWALGDCAIVHNAANDKPCPPTAQFADRQAKFLAKNLVAKITGNSTKAFHYKPMGMLASIGRNNAVAEVFGIRLTGLVAFMMWRGVYLLKVPTFSRKVRLFLEWNWAMIFPPDVAHLGFKRSGED